jgi:2-polyprenyl-6-methoxyphenol hydroxylase-like FAD-dependent oxidoreductase
MHADLVVGADGMRSTMAKLTGTEEYLVQDSNRSGYWTYYPAPATWSEDWDAILEHRGDELRYVFRCDDDQLLVVYVGPQAEVAGWGGDHRDKLAAALLRSETTAAVCRGKSPTGKTTGLIQARYLYRRPVGPGWALVGDAGHFKDFVTGHGMTDALLDAQNLSEAILDGRPEAFEAYWRERDVLTLPLHFDALRMGAVGFNEPFMRWVIDRVGRRPELGARLGQVFDRKISPDAFIPAPTMLGFILQALVRGRFGVLPGFLATGRQLSAEAKELAARKALAVEAREALARAEPKGSASAAQRPAA